MVLFIFPCDGVFGDFVAREMEVSDFPNKLNSYNNYIMNTYSIGMSSISIP